MNYVVYLYVRVPGFETTHNLLFYNLPRASLARIMSPGHDEPRTLTRVWTKTVIFISFIFFLSSFFFFQNYPKFFFPQKIAKVFFFKA